MSLKIIISSIIVLMMISGAYAEIPPVPTTPTYTQGNYWINYSWNAGTGNVTNGYNVSVTNNSVQYWVNGTARFLNSTVAEDQWSNITIWGYNALGSGNLSLTNSSKSVQAVDTRMTAPGSFWRGFKLYGSWIDLMGFRGIRNGSIQDVACHSNCSGFTTGVISSTGWYLSNGTNALDTGCYNDTRWNPINGTVEGIKISTAVGNIDISVMYNATSEPVNPQDVFVTTTSSPSQNLSLNTVIAKYGTFSACIGNNDLGATEVNIGLMLRRN